MEVTILSLPLVSFLWCVFLNRQGNARINAIVAIVLSFASAFLAAIIAQRILAGVAHTVVLGHWIQTQSITIPWTFVYAPVSGVMYVIVTLVSALVHLYSIAYMEKDERLSSFMGYLGLFTSAMLVLVSGDNFLQIFLGWEGVGLCSYLLIGFWYTLDRPAAAATKAFLMNRVGDIGFIVAMGLLYSTFKTLSLTTIVPQLNTVADYSLDLWGLPMPFLEVTACALLWAAMGKSAQILLHTWLPDAMEGPTPVSALIHAATMVTAGIFLLVRMNDLLALAPLMMSAATVVGIATSLFAGAMALVQYDIKRVVAYSTCSQLGLMLVGVGLGAAHVSLFHITTHAFFKALLFLGAGAVIHGLSDEQDMRNMGGLYKIMPFTYVMMVVASASMIGVPGFSGYYSKEALFHAINGAPLVYDSRYLEILFLVCIALTAMYTVRMIVLTFHGKSRINETVLSHVHEPAWPMFVAMATLSLGSLFLGYFLQDFFLPADSILGKYLHLKSPDVAHGSLTIDGHMPTIIALSAAIAMGFIVSVFHKFQRVVLYTLRLPYIFLVNRGYFDLFYDVYVARAARQFGAGLRWVVDEVFFAQLIVKRSEALMGWFHLSLRRRHSGFLVDYYMYVFVVVLLAFVLSFIYPRMF